MKNQPLLDRKSCASRKHKTPHLFCIDLLEAAESTELKEPQKIAWPGLGLRGLLGWNYMPAWR
jgi:hypothetical protein